MSVSADEIVRRALALVGSPFRPQGRDSRTGVDCVGLVLCVFGIPGKEIRRNYRLRGAHRREIEAQLSRRFRRITSKQKRGGDVLLCSVSADQMHLAINCAQSFVHADARLRRVVETPGSPIWPITGVYRLRATQSISS